MKLSETELLAVPCPTCRAASGAPCTELRRGAAHQARVVQAEFLAHWRAGPLGIPRAVRTRWRERRCGRRD
jgi:hypothetical protein